MDKKYIGISSRSNYDTFERLNVTVTYLNLVKKINFIPLILPFDLKKEDLTKLLNLCSAFLITGGDDLNPIYYQQELHPKTKYDSRLDELDLSIIDHGVKYNKKILGICRGAQIINVYFGGKLIQHLNPRQLSLHFKNKHFINSCAPFFFLEHHQYLVNSYHHQGIVELGKNLKILFFSKEIIEGFIHQNYNIIGLQWHIEQDLESELTNKILDYFICI